MPSRNITLTLLGFALLLGVLILSSKFPESSIHRTLTYSLDDSWDTALEDLETISIALGRYHTTARSYPTTEQGLAALVARPTAAPVPAAWSPKLETLPTDPWDNPYVYEFHGEPDANSGRQLDLYCLGPDGIPSDDDIEAEIDL